MPSVDPDNYRERAKATNKQKTPCMGSATPCMTSRTPSLRSRTLYMALNNPKFGVKNPMDDVYSPIDGVGNAIEGDFYKNLSDITYITRNFCIYLLQFNYNIYS